MKSVRTTLVVKEEQREQFGAGCRNNTSHPHQTVSLGSHVWVVDLGKEREELAVYCLLTRL